MKTKLDVLKEWSFSVFDNLKKNSKVKLIIFRVNSKKLKKYKIKKRLTIKVWLVFRLDYLLCFSGGKDSSVLIGIYKQWLQLQNFKPLSHVKIVFSDTLLEMPSLYQLVSHIEDFAISAGISFIRTKPISLHREYWLVVFGLGGGVGGWGVWGWWDYL